MESLAFPSSCQNPQAPGPGRSMEKMVFSSGSRSRMAAIFGRLASSVTSARAPELESRYSSPSSPKSVNSGSATAPSL